MSDNFFLDGMYNQKQINSINNIKGKSAQSKDNKQTVNGNNDSIFNDINTYKSDSTQKTNNSDLFNYIDQIMGMNDFLNMLDQDGDGKISQDEANKLSTLDSKKTLSSSDIDKLANDIKAINSAKSTQTNGITNTEYTYTVNSAGSLIKKSATETNTKTNKVTAEYTYNSNGNKATKIDKTLNRTTTYKYDSSNKLVSSETRANNKEKTLCSESTYDANGRKTETKVYIDSKTGKKYTDSEGKQAYEKYEYGYDKQGRQTTEKRYGSNGKIISDLTYIRDKNGKVTGYKNAVNNSTTTYIFDSNGKRVSDKTTKIVDGKEVEIRTRQYNDNGKLAQETHKDEKGAVTKTIKYNENGRYFSISNNNETSICEYDEYGILKNKTRYASSDIGADGKVKSGAKALETEEYTEGVITKSTTSDGKKNFYEGGKLKTEIEGDYAYVYTYNSDGTKVKTKYNASDIDENGKVKPGATPITTSSETKTDETNTENKTNTEDKTNNSTNTTKDTSEDQQAIIDKAKEYLGSTNYQGKCSYFAKTVCKNSGVDLADWFKKVDPFAKKILPAAKKANAVVKPSEARPGDLIVYTRNGKPYHTEILYKINDDGTILTISGDREKVRIRKDRGNINNSRYNYIRVTA